MAFKRRGLVVVLSILTVLLGTGLGGYYYLFKYTGDLVDGSGKPINLSKPENNRLKRASYVYDNKGQIVGRFFDEVRDPVRITEVHDLVKYGFVAAEDKKYYRGIFWGYLKHPGIDPIAIFRAFVGNIAPAPVAKYLNYSRLSGASGISQQYTRLLYEYEVPEFRIREKTVSRKIKEAKIAIQLARRYSPDKLLENFLNTIYLGHGVNGIAEATQRYFGKDIRRERLTLCEIAILVSLNKSPYLYCPIFHKPDEDELGKEEYNRQLAKEILRTIRARDRYNWVLKRMLDDGYIKEREYGESLFTKDEPLELEHLKIQPLVNPGFSYGNRLVKEFLLNLGFSDKDISYYGGFQIFTTFDPQIQKIATEEFEKHLDKVNVEKSQADRLNGAFVILETKTGNILAMSGGYDFSESQYNRVLASRSSGSGFKPFDYAAAIEYFGYDFFSKICNCPINMRGNSASQRWIPQNFEEKNPVPIGFRDLAELLFRSVNLGTLNLARSISIEPIIELSNRMGIWGNPGVIRDSRGDIWFRRPGYQVKGGLVPLLPTAIGASDVNLLELANAYAVFFRGGIYMRPTLIKELKHSDGESIVKIEISYQERVLSEDTANKMVALLRSVTKIGTAKISMRNIEQQVACKTGTSDGPRDVSMWCGTPDLVIAIRIGHDDYRVIELPEYMKSVSGDPEMQVSGGWVVGPLVRKMIDRIYSETRPKTEFSEDVELKLETIVQRYR